MVLRSLVHGDIDIHGIVIEDRSLSGNATLEEFGVDEVGTGVRVVLERLQAVDYMDLRSWVEAALLTGAGITLGDFCGQQLEEYDGGRATAALIQAANEEVLLLIIVFAAAAAGTDRNNGDTHRNETDRAAESI